ncbi:hypothetical protein A6A05_15360 [Magnetospirillum moscoviense]|uniref:Uncharacterized protein n=2 Tax=Magnetospirillum moscoviense TaxID=1437059 RepID=A0A178MHY2_9PROT|nr:hypothetical protein A6A05_15360 [Magnetospirillum moscoviense]
MNKGRLSNRERREWDAEVYDVPKWKGLTTGFVKENSFPGRLTYEAFITHLRNAMSHPTPKLREPLLPSTGYTTVRDGSGIITRLRFTDSPWVRRGQYKEKITTNEVEKMANALTGRHPDATISVCYMKTEGHSGPAIYIDEERWIPVFTAEMDADSLYLVAEQLAESLAAPLRDVLETEALLAVCGRR